MPYRFRRQDGMALVMVLWFISLLTILALGFSQTMRSDTRVTANMVEALRARHLAEAAMTRGIYGLVNQETAVMDAVITGNSVSFELEGVEVSYRIEDEHGKVDINQAEPELIANLFVSQGVDDDRALTLTDRILDWRDENDLRRLHGAEGADYRAAGMVRMPADAPFGNIAELQHLMGMEPAIYNRIAPLITVHGGSARINSRFAPRGVLQALPGIDSAELEEYIAYRETVYATRVSPAFPGLTGVESWLAEESGPVYTIHGKASLPSGAFAARRIIVWIHSREESTHYILESAEDYIRTLPGETDE